MAECKQELHLYRENNHTSSYLHSEIEKDSLDRNGQLINWSAKVGFLLIKI